MQEDNQVTIQNEPETTPIPEETTTAPVSQEPTPEPESEAGEDSQKDEQEQKKEADEPVNLIEVKSMLDHTRRIAERILESTDLLGPMGWPASTAEQFSKCITEIEKLFEAGIRPDNQFLLWYSSVISAMRLIENGPNVKLEAAAAEGGDWRPYIVHKAPEAKKAKRIQIANPNPYANIPGGSQLSGTAATELFCSRNNLGRKTEVPLWNSGLFVRMAPATISYDVEIDRAIALSRSYMGLRCFGLINSTDDLVFREVLVDAALKLVVESNMPWEQSPLELKEYIHSIEDSDALIWGMANAVYPEGFDISVPCTNPNCRHVEILHTAVSRMMAVDYSKFTEAQLDHMARGIAKKVTEEDLVKYRAEFAKTEHKFNTFNYNGQLFTFHNASIEDFFTIGRSWFEATSRAVVESMTIAPSITENDRTRAINQMMDVEDVCRYAHYIKEIAIPVVEDLEELEEGQDGYAYIRDPDSIRGILKTMVSDPDGVNKLIMSIMDYIRKTTRVIIGVENDKCSKCGSFRTANDTTPIIYPVRVPVAFFILLQRRIQRSGNEVLTDLQTLGRPNLMTENATDSMSS